MNNLNKIRIDGKIQDWPKVKNGLPVYDMEFLLKVEFPKHVWLSYSKKKDRWIINTYLDPRFDKPEPGEEPDYWMEYEGVFDTPEGLLHQIKHMCGKKWFTREMVNETMDIVNKLHKKLTNKQHWFWAYPKNEELEIINDD
mgnify:FL=1